MFFVEEARHVLQVEQGFGLKWALVSSIYTREKGIDIYNTRKNKVIEIKSVSVQLFFLKALLKYLGSSFT